MQTFIHDDFLLHSDVARELYHRHAAPQPLFDYHCHIPPDQIAGNRKFKNLFEVWLAGDHYKWRAMRTNGVDERFCTGDATDEEKFMAWARTVPHTLRNPLYHWTHLELLRYFGVNELLNEESAKRIWNQANEKLQTLTVHEILRQSRVAVVCTTDDPTDSLEHHRAIRAQGLPTKVYPAFRPDMALAVDRLEVFNTWVDKLSAVSAVDCSAFGDFLEALKKRHDFFHENGGRLSDHGLIHAFSDECTEAQAAAVFDRARKKQVIAPEDANRFRSYLMHFFGELDASRGWVKQLHLGALRNNNARLFKALGPDTGFDSIGDWPQAESLSRYLNKLDERNRLPKTILYNLNPRDNYLFATMIGNFQDGSVAGKIQYGSGWWFLDQKEGMQWQINALSNLGLLGRFVGMLTDSRSFLSYTRHEYFRRILCDMLGNDVERGELPRDMALLGQMVENICYNNAVNYFPMEPGAV